MMHIGVLAAFGVVGFIIWRWGESDAEKGIAEARKAMNLLVAPFQARIVELETENDALKKELAQYRPITESTLDYRTVNDNIAESITKGAHKP